MPPIDRESPLKLGHLYAIVSIIGGTVTILGAVLGAYYGITAQVGQIDLRVSAEVARIDARIDQVAQMSEASRVLGEEKMLRLIDLQRERTSGIDLMLRTELTGIRRELERIGQVIDGRRGEDAGPAIRRGALELPGAMQ